MLSRDNIKEIVDKWLLRTLIYFIVGSVLIFTVNTVVQAKHKSSPQKIVIKKSLTPTQIPTKSPTLTLTPSNTPTPTPTIIPTQTPTPSQTSDISSYLLEEVNKYRESQGLSKAQMDSNTCDFAKKRAEEISANFNHGGFKNLPYADYSKVTENIAMNSNYKKVVPNWINSSGHAENMRADTPFICVEDFGKYYVLEGWRP